MKIFCSYSHKDENLKQEMMNHLAVLINTGLIETWDDRKIMAGGNWVKEIDDNIQTADIILALISSDFLASKYCYDIELKRAIERHEKKETRLIPILLRECDWKNAPFAHIQGLPKDMKPIISKNWHSNDEAFYDVIRGLRSVINEIDSIEPNLNIDTDKKNKGKVYLAKKHEIFDNYNIGINKGESLKINFKIKNDDILNGVVKQIKYQRKKRCNLCNGSGLVDHIACKKCLKDGYRILDELIKIQIPPGSQNVDNYIIQGKGNYKKHGDYGDLLITVTKD